MKEKDRSNIYFPVYKRIENEVQKLASAIYFSDDQIEVYSLDIADLIVRCVVEVESIAKAIYRIENEAEPKTPGDCFTWMEDKWGISKKKVVVVSPYLHFKEMKSFLPFDYKKKSKEDYYSIYNAIKHDRGKNIRKASVYALVRALGALFLLNIYFNNERLPLQDDHYGMSIDRTFGSSFFSICIEPCKDIALLSSEKHILPEQSLARRKLWLSSQHLQIQSIQ